MLILINAIRLQISYTVTHPVPDRVKLSFVIFDIRALFTLRELYPHGDSGRQRVNIFTFKVLEYSTKLWNDSCKSHQLTVGISNEKLLKAAHILQTKTGHFRFFVWVSILLECSTTQGSRWALMKFSSGNLRTIRYDV